MDRLINRRCIEIGPIVYEYTGDEIHSKVRRDKTGKKHWFPNIYSNGGILYITDFVEISPNGSVHSINDYSEGEDVW